MQFSETQLDKMRQSPFETPEKNRPSRAIFLIVREVPSPYMVKKIMLLVRVKVEIFCNAKNTTLMHTKSMIKNHHVSGGTIVFLVVKMGCFWGRFPCIYTLETSEPLKIML